jgi:hypothetical protein
VRYGLSPYIKQIRLVFKGLIRNIFSNDVLEDPFNSMFSSAPRS